MIEILIAIGLVSVPLSFFYGRYQARTSWRDGYFAGLEEGQNIEHQNMVRVLRDRFATQYHGRN